MQHFLPAPFYPTKACQATTKCQHQYHWNSQAATTKDLKGNLRTRIFHHILWCVLISCFVISVVIGYRDCLSFGKIHIGLFSKTSRLKLILKSKDPLRKQKVSSLLLYVWGLAGPQPNTKNQVYNLPHECRESYYPMLIRASLATEEYESCPLVSGGPYSRFSQWWLRLWFSVKADHLGFKGLKGAFKIIQTNIIKIDWRAGGYGLSPTKIGRDAGFVVCSLSSLGQL